MDNIGDIISSLSAQDIERLKETAKTIFPDNEKSEPVEDNPISSMDPSVIQKVTAIMSKMNTKNSRTEFINALKPLLSTGRQKKADEAVKILKLMELLPLINGGL